MGLTKEGDGARAIKEGWTLKDGKLPVNVSGGLKAKGHPIGATGRLDACALGDAARRRGAGGHAARRAEARRHLQHGGAAVANYVSVLERIK